MNRLLPRSAALLVASALLASASLVSAQFAERPADRLSRHLRELAADPANLAALIGAGQAALDVGDSNAALGFFARADERSPRNGQVKAGLARALLMTDNARDALRMFDEAKRLGVPDLHMAGDRGLAYDLRGNNRRAQQDYALALSASASDEVSKRYALSLGISGDRDQALKLLDPLLYKRDQGAWRARAFVLAMTGDVPGASAIVHQVMPARMAQSMDQFLGRLAGLNAAQKAAAVHLGEMPANARLAASTAAAPMPLRQAVPAPTPTPSPRVELREPRRRPGAILAQRTAPAPAPTPVSAPAPSPPPLVAPIASAPAAPLVTNPAAATPRGDLDAIIRDIQAAAATNTALPVAASAVATPAPRPTPARAEPKPAPPPKPKAAPAKPAPPKHPPRIWVQVAGGANAAALPREWTILSGKAAELNGKGPWTARNRATNRLLAGPFKTAADAQAAVTRLRKAGISAFQWASDEGEAVDKLGAR